MDSKLLNDKIGNICAYDSSIEFNAFGGKPIPYIGWFWRDVDFDNFDRYFGVIPVDSGYDDDENHEKPLVGFMENNKWNYDLLQASEREWKEIRRLLEIAANDSTDENLKVVNDAIQNLYKGSV